EGRLISSGLKIAVLAARFNQFVTERLLQGALELYTQHGGDPADTRVVMVPGAFEMPLIAQKLAASGSFDALVALAAVVRGETPHFEYVSSAAAQGLSRVSLDTGVPVGFGVLTTDTMEQAIDRAGAKGGNKGAEAMRTAIEMANLLKTLE
ncbi:MAG: 6,7-dimethyl-8-ribityllumazine synthase, partial [bacterium]